MHSHEVVIIGGGIFGCSVAKYLSAHSNLDVAVVEKEHHLAQHQSGRNSGTLHPGLVLNLQPRTRKAKFAIEGGRRLKSYCEENDLPIHSKGLMVVGKNRAEYDRLESVYDRVDSLGIDLSWLDANDINAIEPNVAGEKALHTKDSSTVLTADITYSFAQDAWNNGAEFYMGYQVDDITRTDRGIKLATNNGEMQAGYLVNAAGVWAPKLAKRLGFASDYDLIPFRGQYYELTPGMRDKIRTNVYPTSMPPRVPNSVGVHFTRRPDDKVIVGPTGMIAMGPDTYGSTELDLQTILETVKSSRFWKFIASKDTMKIAWTELNKTYRKRAFLEHCRRLLPEISGSDITKSYVGISHYLVDNSGTIQQDSVFERGANSIHILRPKPGLTSSISIGEYVGNIIIEQHTDDTTNDTGTKSSDSVLPMPDPDGLSYQT